MNRNGATDSYQNPGIRGSNQAGIRAHNERLLLSILRQDGPMAKADIARATGLSAQTVSNIMRGLETDGLIVKGEPQRGRVGQPSVPIALDKDGAYFWGLKIGRRSAELVLTNFLGEVLSSAHQTYRFPTPEDTIRFARESVARLSAALTPEQRGRIGGLGIAIPYRIWRWAREINVAPEKMAAWKTFDVTAAVQAVCDCPVFLENDASAACGAELVFGDASLPPDFLYIYLGYFIGGGVVLNNRLFTGPTGNAGAIAPLPVTGPDGRPTQLLDVASLYQLERALLKSGGDIDRIWNSPHDWDVPSDILDGFIERSAAAIAEAIAATLSVIDFEAIVIDGWMPTSVRAELVRRTRAHLDRANMVGLNNPQVLEGSIGPDARALGAASLPLSHRFLLDRRLSA